MPISEHGTFFSRYQAKDVYLEREAHLPRTMIRWADELRSRGLEDLGLVLVRVLQVWGFVGSQVLWMLSPFLGEATINPVAEALETPETLEQMRAYLTCGVTEGE
ncbi:MAG: hypothetical protein ACP5HS_04310 [Anaerolineae bacterium]